jgi:hypothetical protein
MVTPANDSRMQQLAFLPCIEWLRFVR